MNTNPESAESARAANVSSPCIHHCVMDSDGHCAGCRRRLDEIALWGSMTETERRAIMLSLPGRDRNHPGGHRG